MKKVNELIKIFDFESIHAGEGEDFRFRLEVLKEMNGATFFGKVYRLETYRLQPTFPQKEGDPPDWINDALVFVMDDMFDLEKLKGRSWNEVLDKFLISLRDIFGQGIF